MLTMPPTWLQYTDKLSTISKIKEWEPLRIWGLSEVWRVTLSSGEKMIAKLGKGTMKDELSIYQEILFPLKIKVPTLYNEQYKDDSVSIFLMEDLGGINLEENPKQKYFIEASRELARIRKKSIQEIANKKLSKETFNKHFVPLEDYLVQLNDIIVKYKHKLNTQIFTLKKLLKILPNHLQQLYSNFPICISHNDFYPKNLLVKDENIFVIDWSNSYLSPHLGDLFGLIREYQGIFPKSNPNDLINAYKIEIGDNSILSSKIEWQIVIGGICWYINTILWIIDNGIKSIPGSEQWIPEMIYSIKSLIEQLESM